MEIVKATESDSAAIVSVVNAAYALETGSTGVAFKNCSRYVTDSEEGETEIRNDISDTWVLKQEGEIVGSVCARIHGDLVCIGPVAVSPKYQGNGIGSRLLKFAESLAPTPEIGVVSCRTDLFPMYERRGYVETSRAPVETYVPPHTITRKEDKLQMVYMRKSETHK